MPLTQAQRIQFSKAIVEADRKVAIIDSSIAALQKEKTVLFDRDQANKALTDSVISLITQYHTELSKLSSSSANWRISLTESIIQSSAAQTTTTALSTGNLLYWRGGPSGPTPPSHPAMINGYWTLTVPFALTVMQGLEADGTNPSVGTNEQTLISNLQSAISNLTSTYVNIERSTFQRASQAGTCSLNNVNAPPGGIITNSVCTGGGGTWSAGVDSIYSVAAIGTLAGAIATAATALSNHLATYVSVTDPARQAANNAELASAQALKTAIDTWLTYSNNNTGHGQTTAAGFYAYNPNLLSGNLKYRDQELNILLSAISTRSTARSNRVSALTSSTYLGGISQDNAGVVTGNGLYKTQWDYAALRLNMIGGSLFSYNGIDKAIASQQSSKAQIQSEKATYLSLLGCSGLIAPTNNTKFVSVKDGSLFQAPNYTGQNVYICSDTRAETQGDVNIGAVVSVNGNRIEFSSALPDFYFVENNARIYFDKT